MQLAAGDFLHEVRTSAAKDFVQKQGSCQDRSSGYRWALPAREEFLVAHVPVRAKLYSIPHNALSTRSDDRDPFSGAYIDHSEQTRFLGMRFKSRIKAVGLFEKVCASLATLSPIAWCRLTDEDVQFTIIPDKGSQCWSKLTLDTIFEKYYCQSASEKNTINLELPLQALSRALKSAHNATEVWVKLTKKDNVPMLSLTIQTSTHVTNNSVVTAERISDEYGDFDLDIDLNDPAFGGAGIEHHRERQTIVTQDIPVKVLHPQDVGGLHEPRLREPDIHIYMPNLAQLKSVSDRFTRLAIATAASSSAKVSPKLELSANMHGALKLGVKTDALSISSHWTNLLNPELDATQFEGGEQAVRDHPSTRMRDLGGPDGQNEAGWAKVRVDAKDWSRVLSVGRVSSRVVGCIVDDTALVMYCWIGGPDEEEESCLIYYISSFSA